jgi:hypothetical protein
MTPDVSGHAEDDSERVFTVTLTAGNEAVAITICHLSLLKNG